MEHWDRIYLCNLIIVLLLLALALRLPVDILHVYFEVVIPGELLVAQLALCHGPVGVVGQLVSAKHLLQAERQVTHLRNQDKIASGIITNKLKHLYQL